MKVSLFGAGGDEVTGSAYVVESGMSKVLIDCGLFQDVPNADQKNRIAERYTFRNLDSVLLTHAHLDHTGRLPILVQRKFTGYVFCTEATADLTALILRDAAKIQAGDIVRLNRRREREGKPPLEPLYSPENVEQIGARFRTVAYNKTITVAPAIEARWIEAGHLLGSASIQLTVIEQGQRKTVVFSGDLGRYGVPLTRSASSIGGADAVFMESTYGDREHRSPKETLREFTKVVRAASDRGAKFSYRRSLWGVRSCSPFCLRGCS